MSESKVFVSEEAVRQLVREALGSAHLGDLALPEEPPAPVNVNAVVDPSACDTDPINPDYVPETKQELDVAVKRLTKDVPISKVPDVYRTLKDAIEADAEADMENDEMKKAAQGGTDQVEEAVRKAVREELKEISSTMSDLSYSGTDFGDASDDEDDDSPDSDKPKRAYKDTAIGGMADVGGASFQEIANDLGLSVAGAKRAVDMALDKARFMATGIDEDERDILVLMAMNDYINMLGKTGELSPADVKLMKDHPEIVQELDGFREFLHTSIKRARKGAALENPLGDDDDDDAPVSEGEVNEVDPKLFSPARNDDFDPMAGSHDDEEDEGPRSGHRGRGDVDVDVSDFVEGRCPACKSTKAIVIGEAKDPGVACGACKRTTWLREAKRPKKG